VVECVLSNDQSETALAAALKWLLELFNVMADPALFQVWATRIEPVNAALWVIVPVAVRLTVPELATVALMARAPLFARRLIVPEVDDKDPPAGTVRLVPLDRYIGAVPVLIGQVGRVKSPEVVLLATTFSGALAARLTGARVIAFVLFNRYAPAREEP
jgi:hypothetical protein